MEFFKLYNSVKIPSIGTGPSTYYRNCKRDLWPALNRIPWIGKQINSYQYRLSAHKAMGRWIETLAKSLQIGYRMIDYSSAYGNEELIQRAITKSGVNREDLFVISRASNNDQYNHRVRESFMNSLEKIGTDYLDCYMFHWPVTEHFIESYKEIERLYNEGLIKSIGICNCHQHHIESIKKECDIMPMVNEFEVHPLFTQKPLVKYCQEHNIQVIAYTPLAKNDDRLRKNPILKSIAKKYSKSLQQVILRWDVQNGIIPIPYSSSVDHNRQNFDIFDFFLTDDEVKAIDSININSRLRFDPDNLDFHSIG